MTRRGITITFLLAFAGGCNPLSCGCCVDGQFWLQGMVVDRAGRAVPNVTVKARNTSSITDQHGCFQIMELTHPYKHEMPFSVTATGFTSLDGTMAAPTKGRVRMRISLADSTSTASTVLDTSPKPDALGLCEQPKVQER